MLNSCQMQKVNVTEIEKNKQSSPLMFSEAKLRE